VIVFLRAGRRLVRDECGEKIACNQDAVIIHRVPQSGPAKTLHRRAERIRCLGSPIASSPIPKRISRR
jgi:hypothetical protein